MSTTRNPETSRIDFESTVSTDWTILQCPVDGQLLGGHHQLENKHYECPRCQQILEPWEVVR